MGGALGQLAPPVFASSASSSPSSGTRPPRREVLSDGERYADWVVGTARVEPDEGRWPEPGAALRYEIRIGPRTLHNRTVVRRSEPTSILELEVHSGLLGTARIAMELRPWGGDTLLIFDEHPLRGVRLREGLLHAR